MLYERYHTRQIATSAAWPRRMPLLAFFMLLFTLSSIGLPGLNGFAGEFLLLLAAFQRGWADVRPTGSYVRRVRCGAWRCWACVLGAWYMLWLYQRVFFGPLREPKLSASEVVRHGPIRDLHWREILALAPLAVFVVWIGVQPKFFLDRMAPTLNQAIAAAERPLDRPDQRPTD